jgi:hypothetical protein
MIHDKIRRIQEELNVPKDLYNSFGKYNYRSAEGILKALKPLLAREELVQTITYDVVEIASIPVIVAKVRVTDGKDTVETTAPAGVEVSKKGMDYAQTFGASGSYSAKYALGGMWLIDDGIDPDKTNTHGKTTNTTNRKATTKPTSKVSEAKEVEAEEVTEASTETSGGDYMGIINGFTKKNDLVSWFNTTMNDLPEGEREVFRDEYFPIVTERVPNLA